jgi:mannose-6-phosphate isomerase-like protein (cupin superfamily)
VMILRGSGDALVGTDVIKMAQYDVVHIPARTWHQFRATGNEPFGFLCLVNIERDRPELPDEAQIEEIKRDAAVSEFIRT